MSIPKANSALIVAVDNGDDGDYFHSMAGMLGQLYQGERPSGYRVCDDWRKSRGSGKGNDWCGPLMPAVGGEVRVVRVGRASQDVSWDEDGNDLATFKDVLAANAGKGFDRLIFVAHGTMRGPLFCCDHSPQMGWDYPEDVPEAQKGTTERNLKFLDEMVGMMSSVLSPSAVVYLGFCNAGTDPATYDNYRQFEGYVTYADLIAQKTGRTAFGVANSTSGWDVVRRVAFLEAQGIAFQQLVHAEGSGAASSSASSFQP